MLNINPQTTHSSPLTTNSRIFVPDIAAFRRKMQAVHGITAHLWQSIRTLPQASGNLYSQAFRYLVTGDDACACRALEELERALLNYRAGDLAIDVHFHTWCNAAPMARMAVMFDWIAEAPCVTPEVYASISEQLLDYALKHPYQIAKSRVRGFDNQVASMSFCCTMIGYLFGVRRGNDPRAQRLMEAGLLRFPDIFALSPRGGYSGEGSTYFCQIVAPVVTWYCALAEEITGVDYFNQAFPPTGCSPREILQLYRNLVGPSGLMPPWDHYGWMHCASTMGLAYLARKTGDPIALGIIERLSLAMEPNQIAWGQDDRIWTLLWWPEEEGARELDTPSLGEVFPSWALANVGGALVEERKAWRLFQAWDRCAPSVYCGRSQVNPNMITLDVWGSPVFTDGIPDNATCTLFNYPIDTFRDMMQPGELDSLANYYRTFTPNWKPEDWVKGFAYGLIGGSNSVVINGEGHYAPAESREGRLASFAALPNFKLLAGEAAAYYQPRYPIDSALRTSMLVRDDYYLVCDHLSTTGPALRFDWQVFSRGQVTAEQRNVHVSLPEGVELDIIALHPDAEPVLTEVPGFPRSHENRSTRIQYAAQGQQVCLPFLLFPQRRFQPVAELADGWAAVGMTEEAGLRAGLPAGVPGEPATALPACGLQPSDDGWIWAGRTFSVPDACRGKRVLLHFASRVSRLLVWVDGQACPLLGETVRAFSAGCEPPAIVDITGALAPGETHTIVLAGATEQGKLVNGAAELMVESAPAPAPAAHMLTPGHFEITGQFGRDDIFLGGADEEIHISPGKAAARALLLHDDGTFAALQATRLQLPGCDFHSDRPLDLAVTPGQVTLSDLSGPEELTLRAPDYSLRVASRGVLSIDMTGASCPILVLTLTTDKPVFVNGRYTTLKRDAYSGQLTLLPEALAGGTVEVWREDAGLAERQRALLSLTGDEAGVNVLLSALADPDWRVQVLAAETLGRVGDRRAVPPLLEVLARETPERIYPDNLLWWGDANQRLAAQDPTFDEASGNAIALAKRHRLKTVIIEALGRLSAPEAVPALCGILEDQREFYPVHSVTCRALWQIGDPAALPVLEKAANYAEINTRIRARDAIARLTTGHPARLAYPDSGE